MPVFTEEVTLAQVATPPFEIPSELPMVPRSVYKDRLNRTKKAMEEAGLDRLVIYADREHFANFEYLAGFDPRFEEALLIVRPEMDGKELVALLGNESFTLPGYAPTDVTPVLYHDFSLPSQPRHGMLSLVDLLKDAGITPDVSVGVVGWKLPYTSGSYGRAGSSHSASTAAGSTLATANVLWFDVPVFVMEAISAAMKGSEQITNATGMFISPEDGLRTTLEAEQIAAMEFGSSIASAGVQTLLEHLEPGVSELDLGKQLNSYGLPLSCHPMVSTGTKAQWALTSPSSQRVKLGDEFTTAFGVRGGLTCRAGYVVESVAELPPSVDDWLDRIARPYYAAVASWYEKVGIGVIGGEMYRMIEEILPKELFGWFLNPGHLIATDEWLSSPIFPDSPIPLRSGFALQMDIIPFPTSPYHGVNSEDGIVLADQSLRDEIKEKFPDVWARMQSRRTFMIDTLGIHLKEEVLPMANAPGLLRPLMLNKELAMVVRR